MILKIDIKKLIVSILIPVVLGSIVGLITAPSGAYKELVQPSFAPPGFIFPIVWFILYTLMGVSSYIIMESNSYNKDSALLVYGIQLFVNLLWSIFFFKFNWYLFSFIWIILLIILVIIMIKKFYDISKLSGYLQIPYLIWLVFAAVLNFAIYILN